MTWENFYKNRLNIDYFNHIKKHYKTFIKEIENSINENSKVLEIGCGIGSITRALNKSADYHISDKDSDMLKLSQLNTNIDGFVYDILEELKMRFDVVHSHGVLEHFNKEDVNKIIKNQLKIAKTLIHYVPSNKYKEQSFGDENLLNKEEWKRICEPNEIKEFNNNHDLILIWR